MDQKNIESIKKKMSSKNNEELLQIWQENNRELYSEETFEAVKQLLEEQGAKLPPRGSAIPGTGAVSAERARLTGVKGWLAFFTIVLVVLQPLFLGAITIHNINELEHLPDDYGYILPIHILSVIGIIAFSIIAGMGLRRKKPDAVRIAKTFLFAVLGYGFLNAILFGTAGNVYFSGYGYTGYYDLGKFGVESLIRAIVFFAVWYTYLSVSKRVKFTYPYTTIRKPAV